jgi:hypothetical protein
MYKASPVPHHKYDHLTPFLEQSFPLLSFSIFEELSTFVSFPATLKMQLTILVLPLTLAFSTAANPLADRQSGRIKGTFYTDNGCQTSANAPSQYFEQRAPGICRNVTMPANAQSTFFSERSLSRTSKWSRPEISMYEGTNQVNSPILQQAVWTGRVEQPH